MDSVVVIIEYAAGDKRVRRRLGRQWICPLCGGTLQPEEGKPAIQVRRLDCAECGANFRIVGVETARPKRKK
jgi:hypothetical protein